MTLVAKMAADVRSDDSDSELFKSTQDRTKHPSDSWLSLIGIPYDAHSQVGGDGFKTVERRSRKRRKSKGDSSHSEHEDSTTGYTTTNEAQEQQPIYVKAPKVVIITSDGTNLAKVSPVKIAKALNDICQNMVNKVNKVNNGIAVHCYTAALAAKLKRANTLGDWPVRVEFPVSETQCKGVISGIGHDITEDDLIQACKSDGVIGARRLKRKVDGKFIDSMSLCLTFNSKIMPSQICVGYEVYNVRPYVPPVIRCFKCQGLGHKANACKGKVKCVRCGGLHSFNDCPEKDSPKCCRCGEQHSAAYEGCRTIKTAKKVQVVKVTHNVPYAEAVKIVKETTYLAPRRPNKVGLIYNSESSQSQNFETSNSQGSEEISFARPEIPQVRKSTVIKEKVKMVDNSTQTKVSNGTQTDIQNRPITGCSIIDTDSVPVHQQIIYLVSAVLDIHKKTKNDKERDFALGQLLDKHNRALQQYKNQCNNDIALPKASGSRSERSSQGSSQEKMEISPNQSIDQSIKN